MNKLALVAVAIIPFMAGCPGVFAVDKRAGFDLSLRITDIESNQVAGDRTVDVGFCSAMQENCATAISPGRITDSAGLVSVSQPSGPGCPSLVFNRLVAIIQDTGEAERIDVVVDSTGQGEFAAGNDFVGAMAQGERFSVEVVECIDVFPPL